MFNDDNHDHHHDVLSNTGKNNVGMHLYPSNPQYCTTSAFPDVS